MRLTAAFQRGRILTVGAVGPVVWDWRFTTSILAVVGTLPARGPVACELLTLSKGSKSCARSTVPIRVTAPGTLPARSPVACELLTLSKESKSGARSTVPLRVTAPAPFLSTSTSCVPPRASGTVACHASRERESAEVAKAVQLCSEGGSGGDYLLHHGLESLRIRSFTARHRDVFFLLLQRKREAQ